MVLVQSSMERRSMGLLAFDEKYGELFSGKRYALFLCRDTLQQYHSIASSKVNTQHHCFLPMIRVKISKTKLDGSLLTSQILHLCVAGSGLSNSPNSENSWTL